MITIEDSKPPLSEDDIAAVESVYDLVLPTDYRDFLKAHNGGRPTLARFTFKTPRGESSSSVDWFLAIYEGEHNNFEGYYNNFKEDQVRLPDELVPIAHDAGGNQICLDVSKSPGAVYFWDHEEEADVPDYSNVYLIASSFTEFIDSLHSTSTSVPMLAGGPGNREAQVAERASVMSSPQLAPEPILRSALYVVHVAAYTTRNWTLSDIVSRKQINDLWEALHVVPDLVTRWRDDAEEELLRYFAEYDAKWPEPRLRVLFDDAMKRFSR